MNQTETIPFKNFPALLKEIPDPPKILHIKGEYPVAEKYLTIVGTRKPASYGREAVDTLVKSLKGLPIAIISGLALGTDALAHEAALKYNIPTIAVPGSGLGDKVLYPRQNVELAKNILKSGGCLLSEFDDDFKATDFSFPQRNRIMAGLAHATLVIEAQKKSGTLITSKYATDYNRDVLAVPGNIFSTLSEGPHLLLRLGATPITTGDELREALGFPKEGEKKMAGRASRARPETLSFEESQIMTLLTSPLERDILIDQLDMDIAKANAIISLMEIKGIIKETDGEIRLL